MLQSYRDEFGKEITGQEIQGNIIAIVSFFHYFPHLIDLQALLTIVKLKVKSRDPAHSNQTNRVESSPEWVIVDILLCCGIEVEASWTISN